MFPTYFKVVDKPGPAFGSMEYVPTKLISDKEFYDNLDYDEEVNRLLDEVEEEFLKNKVKNYIFPEDTHHVGSIPDWYRDMLKNKIKEAKSRLERLSNLVCAASPSTAAHIKRIEEDHSTTFCKMDYPRHPPMHKSWRSTWEFCYAQQCKETDSNHIHSDDCKSLVVEDFETGMRMDTPDISQHDYPQHVICIAKFFRNFARMLNRKINLSKVKEKSECEAKSKCEEKPKSTGKSKSKRKKKVDTIEDDWWSTTTMVLISNHLNELMIVVRRENVKSLIPHLKAYFRSVIGTHPNIVSVFAFPTAKMDAGKKQRLKKASKRNQYEENIFELLIAGTPVLKDEIGPLSIEYNFNNQRAFFDSVETMQLGKVIQDYMCLTRETTLLDIGSYFGVLSLIMALKCEKVIQIVAGTHAQCIIEESEKLKQANQIYNVSFMQFSKKNIIMKWSPLMNQCITVAIVKLKSLPVKGSLQVVLRALRNLRSIWRVILYGSFCDQLHESIALLMSEDKSLGERYLPMQGCILDKSPTVVNAFDLVILFERKSLIAPKVELFAPGPTVNVSVASETSDDDSMESLDGDSELGNSEEKCEERLSLSTNDQLVPSLPEIKDFQFDRPPPPLGTFPPFSQPPPSVNGEFQLNIPPPPLQGIPPNHPNSSDQAREDFHQEPYPPMREGFQNDYPPSLLDSRFPNPHFHPNPYPSAREDLQFDYPLPLLEGYPGGPIFQGPYAPARDNFQDHYYPPLPPDNYYHLPHHPESYPVVNNEFQNQYEPSAPPLPPLLPPVLLNNKLPPGPKKKKNKPQLVFYPPPPPTRFPSPPPPPPLPPPEETDSLEKESSSSSPPTIVTDERIQVDERVQVCEEEKMSEIVMPAEDVISSVGIKSEPIDPSYSTEVNSTLSEVNYDSPTSTVKDELVQVCEGTVCNIVNTAEDVISSIVIKSEPIDSSYSPDLLGSNYTLSSTTTVKAEPLRDEVKKESNTGDFGTLVKAEPLQDEENKESNVADFGISSSVILKLEPTNQSSSVNVSDCQHIPLPVTVKSNFSPIRSPDCEPMDMQISPSPPDFHSMETPIHNPRALSDITPVTLSKNVSVANSEFPVQTNKSFLVKVNPVDVDREPGEISDSGEENETIVEEKNRAPIISRKLNRPPRPFPGKYSESSHKRRNHGKSLSPKRMRRSPTPNKRRRRSPTPDKRRRRSPSPDKRRRRSPLNDRRREKSRRSPLREAHGCARSPRDRRSRRSRSKSPRRR